MTEILMILFLAIGGGLFHFEKKGFKSQDPKELRCAAIAYTIRQFIVFLGIGLFFIFIGTDFQSEFWEFLIGLVFIILGISLSIHKLLCIEKIEDRFKKGNIDFGSDI